MLSSVCLGAITFCFAGRGANTKGKDATILGVVARGDFPFAVRDCRARAKPFAISRASEVIGVRTRSDRDLSVCTGES